MTEYAVSKDKPLVFSANSEVPLPIEKLNLKRPREEFPDWPAKQPLSLDGCDEKRCVRR